jgi:arginyl-tRNA synthetase
MQSLQRTRSARRKARRLTSKDLPGLLAIGLERYGAESTTGKDPIQHLFEVYVKISADQRKGEETGDTSVDDAARAAFKKMEDGDPEALATWKKIKDLSIAKYKETYDRLNIHFDVYSGESHVSPESQDRAVKQLIEQKIVTEDKGTLLIDLEKYKLGKTPIRKSDGTTLYITRDIGAAIERYEEYKFTKMIYVVASQ